MVRIAVLLTALAITLGLGANDRVVAQKGLLESEATYVWLDRKETSKEQMRARYDAWLMLCFDLRDVQCFGTAIPKVETFRPAWNNRSLLGFYKGGDVI